MQLSIFAERLRRLHRASGLTQQQLSDRIFAQSGVRVPQTTLSGYMSESDPQPPSIVNAAALALFYNVSLDWLCGSVNDRRSASALINRLNELSFSEPVEEVARQLEEMPSDYQAEIVSRVKSLHTQWSLLNSLIKTLSVIDPNGLLHDRIRDLTGIDISVVDSVRKVSSRNVFGNGDLHSDNQQLSLISG